MKLITYLHLVFKLRMFSYTFNPPYILTFSIWTLNPSVGADGKSYVCF